MERHTEIVRQWRLLLALEGRTRALTLTELQAAAGEGVSDRTIRRDLNALAQAGFPIETTRTDGRTRYTLNRDIFGGLATAGFSLSELGALYLSRTLLSALAGGPFHDSLTCPSRRVGCSACCTDSDSDGVRPPSNMCAGSAKRDEPCSATGAS